MPRPRLVQLRLQAKGWRIAALLAAADEHAAGLVLIFPPYQAMPYVYGPQTVDAPVRAFARFLQPRYRDLFVAPADVGPVR